MSSQALRYMPTHTPRVPTYSGRVADDVAVDGADVLGTYPELAADQQDLQGNAATLGLLGALPTADEDVSVPSLAFTSGAHHLAEQVGPSVRSATTGLATLEGVDGDDATCSAGSDLSADQLSAAHAWAAAHGPGTEAISQLQARVGAAVTGVYDDCTIQAVYNQQRQLNPKGPVAHPGQADRVFFQQMGLVWTDAITAATVTDDAAASLAAANPDGVTVAVVPDYGPGVSGSSEFIAQANTFATNQGAVGLQGGQIVVPAATRISDAGDIVEIVQSIHRGLVAAWRRGATSRQGAVGAEQGAAAAANSTAGAAEQTGAAGVGAVGQEGDAPAWTQVRNLAIFCHGETWGIGSSSNNDFSREGLHTADSSRQRASNIESFADGLSGAVIPGVHVQLFACSTGADAGATGLWNMPTQGQEDGETSFAAELAGALGSEASVYAHTTVGHTTENFAARVFGKDARDQGAAGPGGLSLFDLMYPETFIASELTRLYPSQTPEDRARFHDPLRTQMWSHFKDAINTEHGRSSKAKVFPVPMGQECFANPDHARTLLHDDWTTRWIPSRLASVKPAGK